MTVLFGDACGKLRAATLAALLVAALVGCQHSWRIDCDPADASVSLGGRVARNGDVVRITDRDVAVEAHRPGFVAWRGNMRRQAFFGETKVKIRLERELYESFLDSVPTGALATIDGIAAGRTPLSVKLAYGHHDLRLETPGYPAQGVACEVEGPGRRSFRLQKEPQPGMLPLGIYPCGPAPKQVTFTPDGERLFVTLLTGKGFDIIDWKKRTLEKIEVPGFGHDEGFVEGIFPTGHSTFLVSQMTRDLVHEFILETGKAPTLARSMPSRGTWSKVLAFEPVAGLLAVSNWVSDDVTVLDYRSGDLVKRLGGLATPRGLAWSQDGSGLFVASFGGGRVYGFDTADWKRRILVDVPGAAFRHLVATLDGKRLFASDMDNRSVLEIDISSLQVLHEFRTDSNPNTIDLGPGDALLAVSCRGPNNPESYILRSPEPGCVILFDTLTGKEIARVTGGAQPTGLDISPDGKLLAFSNFQDASVEIYDISALEAGKSYPGVGP